jgi:hypothetical protein
VFVTLWGEGFGAAQGGSTVTFGGVEAARYVSWQQDVGARGLDRIVVQPGPGALSGNVVVSVGGRASNGVAFTRRAGNIYFVDPATGSDANPGTVAQPWATLWRPRQTMVAGDTVYLRGGTFSALDPAFPGWDTVLMLEASVAVTGTAASPIAYLGFPGDPPLLQTAAARRGVYFNQDSGPMNHYVVGNLRFGVMEDAVQLTGVGHRFVGNRLENGGNGHKVGIFGDTSGLKVLGNRFLANGVPPDKYYSIYIQGFGVNQDIEVGWNEIRDQEGRAMQVYGHLTGDVVDDLRIHDNVMTGSGLNNLLLGGSDGASEILGTVSVSGNVIAGARGAEGLRINDPNGIVTIDNNTLHGNAVAQIYLEEAGTGNVTLRDNILVATAGQQYYEFDAGSSPQSFVPANNLVWGAGGCPAWDTGCVDADPQFVGAGDYRLQATSPAIDAGVPTSASRDHDGIQRPQAEGWDIGAYERPDPPLFADGFETGDTSRWSATQP